MKALILFLITCYQKFLSPLFMQLVAVHCRYEKSCSTYAKEVISQQGVLRGGAMALNRLLHCQPFTKTYEYI